jgi:hypothetical protein
VKKVAQKKLTSEEWLRDLFDYEAKHPIAFASPRALVEARLIAEMDEARSPRRRAHRNGVSRRRKSVTG